MRANETIECGARGYGVALDAEAVDVVFAGAGVLWQRRAGDGEDDIEG